MSEPKPRRCAVCGVPCIAMEVNLATLCDLHFDAWMEWPKNPQRGGQVEMAEFVADEQARVTATIRSAVDHPIASATPCNLVASPRNLSLIHSGADRPHGAA